MCGGHRKRPATEDEDDVVANNNPESPYAVFLASLRPAKAKGAAPLQDLGEPVLVYTGTKPPASGSQATTDSKPEKKKSAAVKPVAAKDKDNAASASEPTAAKPKRKATADKVGAKDSAASTVAPGDSGATARKPKAAAPKESTKDGDSATAAASGDGMPAKPKPKAPKPPPMTITPAPE